MKYILLKLYDINAAQSRNALTENRPCIQRMLFVIAYCNKWGNIQNIGSKRAQGSPSVVQHPAALHGAEGLYICDVLPHCETSFTHGFSSIGWTRPTFGCVWNLQLFSAQSCLWVLRKVKVWCLKFCYGHLLFNFENPSSLHTFVFERALIKSR